MDCHGKSGAPMGRHPTQVNHFPMGRFWVGGCTLAAPRERRSPDHQKTAAWCCRYLYSAPNLERMSQIWKIFS